MLLVGIYMRVLILVALLLCRFTALLPNLNRPCGARRVAEADDAWLNFSRD